MIKMVQGGNSNVQKSTKSIKRRDFASVRTIYFENGRHVDDIHIVKRMENDS